MTRRRSFTPLRVSHIVLERSVKGRATLKNIQRRRQGPLSRRRWCVFRDVAKLLVRVCIQLAALLACRRHPVDSELLLQGIEPSEFLCPDSLTSEVSYLFTACVNVRWPQVLFLNEETLSHVRNPALGYDANVIDLNGQASLNTLLQHSINLVQALSRVRRKDVVSRGGRQEIHLHSTSTSPTTPGDVI